MKVKELALALSKLDQDAEVLQETGDFIEVGICFQKYHHDSTIGVDVENGKVILRRREY